MNIYFNISNSGLTVKHNNYFFNLNYPKKIWGSYPKREKRFFLDNLAYSNTLCSPLIANKSEIKYNTSKPLVKKYVNKSVLKDIPSAVEDYKIDTNKMIKKFRAINYIFKDDKIKKPVFSAETYKKAVIPFSCGKDSLLTLAVCNEIKLNPVAVYFNDTVSPSENKLKLNYLWPIQCHR